MTQKIEEICESLELRDLKFPFNYLCTQKDYCDYKAMVNSEPICVRYMSMVIKIEKEKK